jgi:hypothetical protein
VVFLKAEFAQLKVKRLGINDGLAAVAVDSKLCVGSAA